MGIAAVLYTGAVLWVTLRPAPWATEGNQERLGILDPAAWLNPGSWLEGRPLEVALNVLMLLPLGVLTGFLFQRRGRVALPLVLTLTLTLVIELAQIPLDRISHPRDLVANGLGAVLGVALATFAQRRISEEPEHEVDRPSTTGFARGPR